MIGRHYTAETTCRKGMISKVYLWGKEIAHAVEAYRVGPFVLVRQYMPDEYGQDIFSQNGYVTQWRFGLGRVDIERM